MQIYIFCILILCYCPVSHAADTRSYLDVARGIKKSTPPRPLIPHEKETTRIESPTIAIPADIALLQAGQEALRANKPGDVIGELLRPLPTLTQNFKDQSNAWHMVACAYAHEGKIAEELICLYNELAVSWNNRQRITRNGTNLFPAYNIPALSRLCCLLANGNFATFEATFGYNEFQSRFFKTICRNAAALKMPESDAVLASVAQRTKQHWLDMFKKGLGTEKYYAAAFELYKIERTNDPIRADVYLKLAAPGSTQACCEAYNLGKNAEPDTEKALKYYEIAARGKHEAALMGAGHCLKKLNQPERARAYFTTAAEVHNSAKAKLELARGNFDLLNALVNDQDFRSRATRNCYHEALLDLGKLYMDRALQDDWKKNFKLGEPLIREAALAGYKPAQAEYGVLLAGTIGLPSAVNIRPQLIQKALKFLKPLVQTEPDNALAHAQLGVVYAYKKDSDRLHNHIIKAFQIDSTNQKIIDYVVDIVEILRNRKNHAAIRELMQEMLAIHSTLTVLEIHLGRAILATDNDVFLARQHFKHAGKNGSSEGFMHLGVSYTEDEPRNLRKGLKYLHCAQRLCPFDGNIMFAIGQTHHALGEHRQALQAFLAAKGFGHLDSRERCVEYILKGMVGKPDYVLAETIFGELEAIYAIQQKSAAQRRCTLMRTIINARRPDFLLNIVDPLLYLAHFQNAVKELLDITKDEKNSVDLRNEARLTLASLYLKAGREFQDRAKKKETLIFALGQVEAILAQTMYPLALSIKIDVILELLSHELLNFDNKDEYKLHKNLPKLFLTFIEHLEQNQPFSSLLAETTGAYGIYLLNQTEKDQQDLAPAYLEKAADLGLLTE